MSTTVTLELPEELAAVVQTPEGMEWVKAVLEAEFEDADDPAVWATPSDEEDRIFSPEASARVRTAMEATVGEPSETMKAAIQHWKLLTGKSSVL